MKVCTLVVLACTSLANGAAVSMKNLAVGFGPKNCVALSRSSAGSCVIATDCEGSDISTVEFAFDCVNNGGIVRHSFGTGGFDTNEEFDTEVKCNRCDRASPEDAVVKPAAAKPAQVPEQQKPAPVTKQQVQKVVPQKPKQVPTAAVNLKVKRSSKPDSGAEKVAEDVEEVHEDVHEDAKDVHKDVVEVIDDAEGTKPKAEVTRYGPEGCVSTWKSKEGHCIMRTDCAKADISKYQFGLVCVDKTGSPVKHMFGLDSFDKEETFDTLIKCDKCMGLEDIPDAVALNGEVVTMSKDIANLKAVMKNISINVQMLNEEVFKSAPAPAPAQPMPQQLLIHQSATHQRTEAETGKKHNLRRSHAKHHHRREDDDDEDDDEAYDDDDRESDEGSNQYDGYD